jgi:hypothetical protein
VNWPKIPVARVVGVLSASFCISYLLGLYFPLNMVRVLRAPKGEQKASSEFIAALKVQSASNAKMRLRIAEDQGYYYTILYVYDPECHWCRQNEPNALALASAVRQRKDRRIRFIGPSLGEDAGHFAGHSQAQKKELESRDVMFVRSLSAQEIYQYALWQVPQTVVIDRSGKIIQRIRGAYGEEQLKLLTEFVKIARDLRSTRVQFSLRTEGRVK